MYEKDKRIVLTLDAGGTNFVFSAIQGYKQIVEPIVLNAFPDDLEACLNHIVYGFEQVKEKLASEPVAISFAFPGPADYKNGIIGGNLPNLTAFRGGVALGPFLQRKFNLPVYINNDGSLFAYGEALHGALPLVNRWLVESGNPRRYENLLGVTFGTGFGGGVVLNNRLLLGDNDCGGYVWCFRNKKYPDLIVEESVSIRSIKRVYQEMSGEDATNLTPKDIFDIAEGTREGNVVAALSSFEELGEMAGAALVDALTLIDGIIVIGGGLAGASKYIIPAIIKECQREVKMLNGASFPRIQTNIFDLSNDVEKASFLENRTEQVRIPGSDVYVNYNSEKRTGIIVSPIGTSQAVMCGAYAYALQQLDTIS